MKFIVQWICLNLIYDNFSVTIAPLSKKKCQVHEYMKKIKSRLNKENEWINKKENSSCFTKIKSKNK